MNNLGRCAREREKTECMCQNRKKQSCYSHISLLQSKYVEQHYYYTIYSLLMWTWKTFLTVQKCWLYIMFLLFSRQIKLKPIKCCNKTPSYHQLQIAPSIWVHCQNQWNICYAHLRMRLKVFIERFFEVRFIVKVFPLVKTE